MPQTNNPNLETTLLNYLERNGYKTTNEKYVSIEELRTLINRPQNHHGSKLLQKLSSEELSKHLENLTNKLKLVYNVLDAGTFFETKAYSVRKTSMSKKKNLYQQFRKLGFALPKKP